MKLYNGNCGSNMRVPPLPIRMIPPTIEQISQISPLCSQIFIHLQPPKHYSISCNANMLIINYTSFDFLTQNGVFLSDPSLIMGLPCRSVSKGIFLNEGGPLILKAHRPTMLKVDQDLPDCPTMASIQGARFSFARL